MCYNLRLRRKIRHRWSARLRSIAFDCVIAFCVAWLFVLVAALLLLCCTEVVLLKYCCRIDCPTRRTKKHLPPTVKLQQNKPQPHRCFPVVHSTLITAFLFPLQTLCEKCSESVRGPVCRLLSFFDIIVVTGPAADRYTWGTRLLYSWCTCGTIYIYDDADCSQFESA